MNDTRTKGGAIESATAQNNRLRDERDQARTDNDRIRVENEQLRLRGNELANEVEDYGCDEPTCTQCAPFRTAAARWRELVRG